MLLDSKYSLISQGLNTASEAVGTGSIPVGTTSGKSLIEYLGQTGRDARPDAGAFKTPGVGDVYVLRLALVGAPEIVVEQPEGSGLADGASRNYGQVAVGVPASKTFTIRNTGELDHTNLIVTMDGTNSSDFAAGSLGTTTATTLIANLNGSNSVHIPAMVSHRDRSAKALTHTPLDLSRMICEDGIRPIFHGAN